ncbi:hypothetical protein HAX54_027257 [Datura stramonium]|uniref:Uncharacterized protein n=1 Tax=Datura stramonium TaxID=4076 RepID=A0ABS8V2X9_DATST|nr:hypothetical protein [Datura stramonium]
MLGSSKFSLHLSRRLELEPYRDVCFLAKVMWEKKEERVTLGVLWFYDDGWWSYRSGQVVTEGAMEARSRGGLVAAVREDEGDRVEGDEWENVRKKRSGGARLWVLPWPYRVRGHSDVFEKRGELCGRFA